MIALTSPPPGGIISAVLWKTDGTGLPVLEVFPRKEVFTEVMRAHVSAAPEYSFRKAPADQYL